MITADRLKQLAPNIKPDVASAVAASLEANRATYGVNTPQRVAHFLGQVCHESGGFTRFTENLNYSAERLCVVWPSRFPNLEAAKPYARNPEALAEKVYSGRMGNVNPGDGAKYKGRGLMQLTGRANYAEAAKYTGLDLVANPEQAADPAKSAIIALGYWKSRGLNEEADQDDIATITRKINGGLVGLPERRELVEKAKRVFA
ncbi:putative chitinase [Caulobacter sp. BE264]|uniref:glycoside hydrolase family 19 protein n=1 Tax=Caulobacter sp. BE264 TaxID=2817724 RepID=UPI002865B8A2|nr:glycoside hydrolase family 19 protein [Caulobacter sp. BE264]MDR7232066.1 putative chitinase [Caulobacter sp. BE264]